MATAVPAAADFFSFNGELPPETNDAEKPPPEPQAFKPLADGAIEPIVPGGGAAPDTPSGPAIYCDDHRITGLEFLQRGLPLSAYEPEDFLGPPGCRTRADDRRERDQLLEALERIGESIAEPE